MNNKVTEKKFDRLEKQVKELYKIIYRTEMYSLDYREPVLSFGTVDKLEGFSKMFSDDSEPIGMSGIDEIERLSDRVHYTEQGLANFRDILKGEMRKQMKDELDDLKLRLCVLEMEEKNG